MDRAIHPVLALICFVLTGGPWVVADDRPPNVIVILVDDLGWADLGCQGSTFHQTPHIDSLARRGVRFTNGYAACAVCSPTRAAYLTGRYPARLGLTDWIRPAVNRGREQWTEADRPPEYETSSKRELLCPNNPYWLDRNEVTIAEELQPHGYVTAHIGKWHLGDTPWYPTEQGFYINIGGCDLGQPPSYFDPYESPSKAKVKPRIDTMSPREQGEYLTDREADEAVQFIREHREKPFFLSLCHYAVHTPIQSKSEITRRYVAQPDPRGLQTNAEYAAMVQSVDESVGRIIATLNDLGLTKQTLVVFTSDNGGLASRTNNAPLRNGKGSPYEGGIRVPWIVSWPSHVAEGVVRHDPVITCDIKPTVLEAAGVTARETSPMDGVSMLSLLVGECHKPADRSLYWHFPHYRDTRWAPYAIVRRGAHKLIRWFEDGHLELYNLAEDLGEANNLASQRPKLASRLEGELLGWLEAVGARSPLANESLPATAAINNAMQRFVARHEIAGAVTAVATPSGVLHTSVSGWADLEDKRRMQADSLFAIASMTKPITATAIMMLQDEGLLDVDDEVAKHLPEFAGLRQRDGRPANLTIRHLLTHTSGLPDVPREVRAAVPTLEALMPHCLERAVQYEPGSRWAYRQSAINVAARIVEVASGLSFPQFLEERLFTPLGMKDTTFYPNEVQCERLAQPYQRRDAESLAKSRLRFLNGKPAWVRDRYPMGSGGLFSTAGDYARFCRLILRGGELDGERLLSEASVREMTSLQTGDIKAGFAPGSGWGLGWCVVREPNGATASLSPGSFGHGGAYGTQAWIDPIAERAYLFMVQRTAWSNPDKSRVRVAFLEWAALAGDDKRPIRSSVD